MKYQFVRGTMTSLGIARIGQVLDLPDVEGRELVRAGRCAVYTESVLHNTSLDIGDDSPVIKRGRPKKVKHESDFHETL